MIKKLILFRLLFLLSLIVPQSVFGAECENSLFQEDRLTPEIKRAQSRFQSLIRSFQPDDNVDIIFEVSIKDKSVAEIEQIITDGESDYFIVGNDSLTRETDGFSQRYYSKDGEWTKTIKVTTHDFQGRSIIPYLQIFYEDQQGGVIRLKPFGNTAAPDHLNHLRSAHGTLYFKKEANGDLSWANEAFKVNGFQSLPKSPREVKLPEGIEFGSPEAETFLQQCWTNQTHVPLAQ